MTPTSGSGGPGSADKGAKAAPTPPSGASEGKPPTMAAPAAPVGDQTHEEKLAGHAIRLAQTKDRLESAVKRERAAKPKRKPLTREQLESMSKAEVRAVAQDRGYDLPESAGRAVIVERFLEAQDQDGSLAE